MKMTNKAVLAMAIAASLGTITSTQAEILLGNTVLVGDDANTPLIIAEELSLQTTSPFVNDSTNRLVINVPTIPGYKTSVTNQLSIKLALLDGAKFAGKAVLNCTGTSVSLAAAIAVAANVADAIGAVNTKSEAAVGAGTGSVATTTSGKTTITITAGKVFDAKAEIEKVATADAAGELLVAALASTTITPLTTAHVGITNSNSPTYADTSTDVTNATAYKAAADALQAALNAIAAKATALNNATANTLNTAEITAITKAQEAVNATVVTAAQLVELAAIDKAAAADAATAIVVSIAVNAAVATSGSVNLAAFTDLLALPAFTQVYAESSAGADDAVPVFDAAPLNAAKELFEAGDLSLTVTNSMAKDNATKLKEATVALKAAVDAIVARITAINTNIAATNIANGNAALTALDASDVVDAATVQTAVDTADTAAGNGLIDAAAVITAAAATVAAAASATIVGAATFKAALSSKGQKDDSNATFTIPANNTMDKDKTCVLTVDNTLDANGITDYYSVTDSSNQRMSALVTYTDGIGNQSSAYTSEFITFKPTIGVKPSLENLVTTLKAADAIIDVQTGSKKFTNDSKAGGDTLNAFVGSIAFNSLYTEAKDKPNFPTKIGNVGLIDLVAIADITVNSPSLVGLQNVYLKANTDNCDGSTTNVGIEAPAGASSVTFSAVALADLEAGVNICVEADGETVIPAGQFSVSVNGTNVDSSNVNFGEEADLYNLVKNGSTHQVLNIPGSAANGDQAYIRIYNVSNFSGTVLGTLRDQSGAIIGTEGIEVVSLPPRGVTVISATDLEALFGTWGQRARLELVADVDELRVQALIRSNNVLENMSGQAAN